MKIILFKIIYWPPINKLIRIVLSTCHYFRITKLKIPPSGKITITLPDNKSFLIDTNQTSFLANVICWKGAFAFEYSKIFYDLVKEMNVFVDIGANIGFYSLLAVKANNNIEVHAFEPAMGPFVYLEKNIDLNRVNNRIRKYKIALSDSIGIIDFYEYKNPKYKYLKYNLGGVSCEVNNTMSNNMEKTQVEATTLNDFANNNLQSGIDLIKIDTEGTENKILENAKAILESIRPIIICETLFNKIEGDLDLLMKKNNYLFYNFVNDKLIKVETIVRKTDNGVRDCFFVPKEKEELIIKYI